MSQFFNDASRRITVSRSRILYFIFFFAVTGFMWIVDHEPKFFFGDSGSYLLTAIYGFIPPDRSFVYGFLIRIFALPFHSLKPLLLMQAVAGILSCVGLVACLKRFGSPPVSDRVCFLIALLFSLEPMNMMFQRFVLTESFSMPVLIAYVFAGFSYLKNPEHKKLIWMQLLGLGLVSLRMIFLPLVLANAFITPLLIYLAGYKNLRKIFSHLAVNLISILALHGAYCVWNGKLSNAPPAYSYWDGFFQLSAWAPAVTAESAANPQVSEIIRGLSKYPLEDPLDRVHHLWNKDGLTGRIRLAAPDLYTANQWARITALRTFKSRPLAVLKIGIVTYSWFNKFSHILYELKIDRGDDIPVSSNLLLRLKDYFPADKFEFDLQGGQYWQKSSVTKMIQDKSGPWFLLLAQTPFVCLLAAIFRKDSRLPLLYLSFISLIYLLTLCFLMPLVVLRLLYPLTVPFFLCAGISLK